MPTILRHTTPRATKPYRCDSCRALVIHPGDTYHRTTTLDDYGIYDWINCNDCHDLLPDVWAWSNCDPEDGLHEDTWDEYAEEHQHTPQGWALWQRLHPAPDRDDTATDRRDTAFSYSDLWAVGDSHTVRCTMCEGTGHLDPLRYYPDPNSGYTCILCHTTGRRVFHHPGHPQ